MPPKKRKIINKGLGESRKKIDLKHSVSFNECEEDYVYSSPYYDKALVLKPQDIKQKLIIASNITQECKEIKKDLATKKNIQDKLMPSIKRYSEFTNIPEDEIKYIFDRLTTADRSFLKTFKNVTMFPEATANHLAYDIRAIFLKYICEQKHFPIKQYDLLKELKTLATKYCNENISIQRLVKNKLIKYQQLPQINRYLLSEHPERVHNRTIYLNKVKEFRLQEKAFFYVEVRRIMPRVTSSGFIAGLAASANNGKVEKFFTKDSTDPIAKKWLQQRILATVPENSVIVLAEPTSRSSLSPMSKKADLIAWLDQNEIPYAQNLHMAELYNLYLKLKGTIEEQGAYEHVFRNAGFPVIIFPNEWCSLNFFKSIWSEIDMMNTYHTGRPEFLKQKILNAAQMMTNLNEAEARLIEEELKMINEDNVMETIVDNIQEMAKSGELQLLEYPKECCGDKDDYFETHVSDIVADMTYG